MNIVFFGDSLTQGTLSANYVDKVAKSLRGHHFFNEGVNGDTSLNLYRRVQQDVIDKQPDGVFIMVGVNDATSYAEPGTNPYFRFVKRVPGGRISPISFRENMRALLTSIRSPHIKTWVALPPAEYSPRLVATLREMNDYAAEICAALTIPTLNLMSQLTPRNIPSRPPMGIPYHIKNFQMMLGRHFDYEQLRDAGGFSFTFDGIHLTEQGAQRIADEVTRFLRANGVR